MTWTEAVGVVQTRNAQVFYSQLASRWIVWTDDSMQIGCGATIRQAMLEARGP